MYAGCMPIANELFAQGHPQSSAHGERIYGQPKRQPAHHLMAKVRKKGSLVQLAERARPHTRREAQWLRWLRPKHAGSQRPRGVPARGGWPPRRRRLKPDLHPPGGHQSRARPLLRGVLACRRLRRIEGRGRIVGEPPPVARGGAEAARRPVGETHTQLEKYTRTSVTRLVVALQPEHQRTGCGKRLARAPSH